MPVTITCDNSKGGAATDTVTIRCVEPPVKEYKFRTSTSTSTIRSSGSDARAQQKLVRPDGRSRAENRRSFEGHTCNIGTAE